MKWVPFAICSYIITSFAVGDYLGSNETKTKEHIETQWHDEDINVVIDQSLASIPGVLDMIVDSFDDWRLTGANLPHINFAISDEKNNVPSLKPDGINTIMLAPIEFDGYKQDLAITISFSNPKTGNTSEVDIIINSNHYFEHISDEISMSSLVNTNLEASCQGNYDSRVCNELYDIKSVFMHEIGHFFGLNENFTDPDTTMYSCTSACEIHKRDLHSNDVSRILELYVPRN